MRAYCTFASKQAVSITLFGPRPNNKHPYFRVCKLGVGKVINRLSILYTINNGSVQNFRIFFSNHEARFEEILGLSIKYFVINRKIGLDGVDKNEG